LVTSSKDEPSSKGDENPFLQAKDSSNFESDRSLLNVKNKSSSSGLKEEFNHSQSQSTQYNSFNPVNVLDNAFSTTLASPATDMFRIQNPNLHSKPSSILSESNSGIDMRMDIASSYHSGPVTPPPGIAFTPLKWYYRDPQGQEHGNLKIIEN